MLRGDEALLTPGDDLVLQQGDQLLLAGEADARRGLDTTLLVDGTASYVLTGTRRPVGSLWRWLSGRRRPARDDVPAVTR